ncbi:MAG TPA: MFS transporter [Pirellulales bacterium]|jgi:sugar porter (SP) family MFS transporter
MSSAGNIARSTNKSTYNRYLLFVAGLGGLLYGVDVGIIAGALPYLEATSKFDSAQLSFVVAAVLLGSVIAGLFAGILSDWIGRKKMMSISGLLFVAGIPAIALSSGYTPLVIGRLLQGISAGFIGVVVPLYLAECLSAEHRGKGTAIFQCLLTLGIVAAAAIGLYFSRGLEEIAKFGDAAQVLAYKEAAWRSIFWVSLPPGILFVIGSLFVAESPRWLFRQGKEDAARLALFKSRTNEQVEIELQEMQAAAGREQVSAPGDRGMTKESLLHRKYVIPFLLACVILACNQATGVNSIIGYNTTILIQAGLGDQQAHIGYLMLTLVNFVVTIVGAALVDRLGRKLLLSLGSAGIIISLACTGFLFRQTERMQVDCKAALQSIVTAAETLELKFDPQTMAHLLALSDDGAQAIRDSRATLVVIYSYGDFHAATAATRSDNPSAKPIAIARDDCVPANQVLARFSNPFGNLEAARTAPLVIDHALITPVPSERDGRLVAALLIVFMAFFAVGPGICVWLALSELMPTRIRSNGMSIALLINQAVSTGIAAVFLPAVGKYGYSSMFFLFAAATCVYFITATFFLPETKGKTLEEIEGYFAGRAET